MTDIVEGVKIFIGETAKTPHTTLIREGCTGSPYCAMEIYIAKGVDYLAIGGLNVHMNDEELEQFFQAVKAVRKARRREQ